jgi:hypothetical protein
VPARRERKTPVVIVNAKGKPGSLVIIHQDDLADVAAELAPFALGSQPGGEGSPQTGANIDDAMRPAGESTTSPVVGRSERRRIHQASGGRVLADTGAPGGICDGRQRHRYHGV